MSARDISERLGVPPTHAIERDTSRSSRTPQPRGYAAWLLDSELPDAAALSDHLRSLLAVAEPVAPALRSLVEDGCSTDWYCWVVSHAAEHAVELDVRLLDRLSALPGALFIDVAGTD